MDALAVRIENGLVKAETMPEALAFCKVIVESQLAPRGLDTPQKVFMAVQLGKELGLKPCAALSSIAIVQGKPMLYGRGLPAIILASGLLEKFDEWKTGEGDNLTAHCRVKRKGLDSERVSTFSMLDAKKAGLLSKPGPWQQYPGIMLEYRARARAFTLFSDVLAGMPVVEEYVGVEPEKKAPKDVAVNDPLLASPVAGENPDVPSHGVSTAETTGDAELYKEYLKRFDECGDLKSAKEVAKSILDAKMNGLLGEDQLADLRQKREEVENNLKGVKA